MEKKSEFLLVCQFRYRLVDNFPNIVWEFLYLQKIERKIYTTIYN